LPVKVTVGAFEATYHSIKKGWDRKFLNAQLLGLMGGPNRGMKKLPVILTSEA